MDFNIDVVIDGNILNEIPKNTYYLRFLIYWLAEKNIKAIVIKSKWSTLALPHKS
jgi:hypothetical protein